MILHTKICITFFLVALLLSCTSNNRTDTTATDKVVTGSDSNKNNEHITEKRISTNNILFFGNSLTAGYGLESQDEAFPALIQSKIDSLNLPYQCINAGLSGETSAGGKARIDWLLKQPVDIFVLELGANDGLRGIDSRETYTNLAAIVEKVKKANPNCKLVLAGMMVPPNMGKEYSTDFKLLFPKLAQQYQMHLIPFLLDDVAGIPKLNQNDGIHPTAAGQHIVAANVWRVLIPLLKE